MGENKEADTNEIETVSNSENKQNKWIERNKWIGRNKWNEWNKIIRLYLQDQLYQIVTFQLIIIYLEISFHLLVYGSINRQFIFPILFALPAGAFLAFITGLFEKTINQFLIWLFISILCLIYSIQLVYHDIFKTFLALYSVGAVGTDVFEFSDQILSAVGNNIYGIMILLLPLVALAILIKNFHLDKKKLSRQMILFAGCIAIHFFFVIMLPVGGKGTYSPYDLYHNTWIQDMSVEQLGMLTSVRFDVKNLLLKNTKSAIDKDLYIQAASNKELSEPAPTQKPKKSEDNLDSSLVAISVTITPSPTPIDTSPNILDINFTDLANSDSSRTIKNMHQYFSALTPANKNKYTGMFEGYNLIMLTAEGFSPYAVDETITPTLYKLTHEGFVFTNFYTPLWWASTSDGEYVACTSLLPKAGVTSFYLSGSNYMPFALGTQFGKLGYSCRAYHDHSYKYYKRNISHPNMGYLYKGVGNGLEITKSWPESDLEMMEVTIPEYINDQPFHTYYMTVSGHMNYTFMGNSMSSKNKAAVEELPYSMEAQAYLACNIELDRALEKLIDELTAKGIMDKTVIALSADHYPYGLEKNKIDELAGHEVEKNFELYRNHFILWSASMKTPIVIDKACSSLDIIPTLSNLFALPYDSRLFMGQDILSDAEPLVIFSNRSFITDKVMYNTRTKEITNLTNKELPENYIETMNQIINNKFIMSERILEEDYYSYVMPK